MNREELIKSFDLVGWENVFMSVGSHKRDKISPTESIRRRIWEITRQSEKGINDPEINFLMNLAVRIKFYESLTIRANFYEVPGSIRRPVKKGDER